MCKHRSTEIRAPWEKLGTSTSESVDQIGNIDFGFFSSVSSKKNKCQEITDKTVALGTKKY